MKRILIIIFILVFLFSCGKNSDEKIDGAILSANIALSKRSCQSAIDILNEVGIQNKNSYYLKTLASAYACRSGFSVTTFFASDIGLSTTPSPFGGATKYSTSQVSVAGPLQNDAKFVDLQKAIDLLLYAGGLSDSTEPTSVQRALYFSGNEAADINSQLVFMMLAQLGKLMEVYADAGTTGVKGSGPGPNNCFTDYSNAPGAIQAKLATYPGACKVTNSPNAQLDSALVAVATRRKRLCQGIVLVNGILDILPSVLASAGGGDLATISTLTTNISSYKSTLTTTYPAVGAVATVMSQYNCENDPAITTATLESYYAIIFEALIQ